jgi:hypothetical protein
VTVSDDRPVGEGGEWGPPGRLTGRQLREQLADEGWLDELIGRAESGGVQLPGEGGFPGGVGNTQQDPVRFASLIDDVEQRLFGTLPDDTWVYPGHGKGTTLGAEQPHLGEWRERGW